MGRRAARALGAVLAIAALTGLLAGWRRTALAERVLLWRLAARGVSPAALRVERLGWRGIALREVVLGPPASPDLAVAELDLTWSAGGLRDGQYDSARVAGLRLRASLRERRLELGALAPLLRGGDEAAPAALLPARELDLRDAQIALQTPQGPARGELRGRLHELDGTLAGELELALRDGREPPRIAPATLRAELSGTPRALRFGLALQGAGGRLRADATGTADLETSTGDAELRIAPLAFAPGGLQPSALLPALEPLLAGLGVANVAGRIEARGTLRLTAGAPDLRLAVALRELGFESELVRVAGLAGALSLRAPPLRTPKGQLLSVALLDPGVPLTDGLLDFQLLPGGVLALRRAHWRWAGGELLAEDVTFDPSAGESEARLQAHELDLAELLALVALEGLGGTGRIGGELRLVRRDGRIRVEDGVLRAGAEGGTIRYRPSASARALAASRPDDLGLALAAFSNFRYERLEARLDGDLGGELRVGLHVRGANPELEGGRPIELNLSLAAPLASLVRSGTETYRVPDAIEERLRAFSEKEAP
jgi:hypothetical protein